MKENNLFCSDNSRVRKCYLDEIKLKSNFSFREEKFDESTKRECPYCKLLGKEKTLTFNEFYQRK